MRHGGKRRILYAKAEHQNFTGSTKDRMAFHILKRAYQEGRISRETKSSRRPAGTRALPSPRSAGLGAPVTIFMPDWMSQERRSSFELRRKWFPSPGSAGVGEHSLDGGTGRKRAAHLLPHQYSNEANVEAQSRPRGRKFWAIGEPRAKPAAFVAGVGTGGTVMGVGRYFRKMDPRFGFIPWKRPNRPRFRWDTRRVSTASRGFLTSSFPKSSGSTSCDRIVQVHDGDAIRWRSNWPRNSAWVSASLPARRIFSAR